MTWFKDNIVAILAIVFSLGTLTFTSVSDSSAKVTNVHDRLQTLEKSVEQDLPQLSKEVHELQRQSAITTLILQDLKVAVTDLNASTKELTKVSTVVAVLDEKVSQLEKNRKK